jgi:phosphoglycerate dehydrogenase-like enzyme
MKVKFANSKTSPKDLDNLIKNSDIISLNLLLTKKTYHLIDERRIKLMRESTYLVNTSRGEIVDQKALLQALKTKRIAGAALDVFEEEPKTEKISEEIVELASLPNVIATPHIAYNTKEAALRLGNEFVENVKACINGKSVNVVD